MSKEDDELSKWERLGRDSKAIAEALFEASKGRVTKLATRNWDDDSSVWEEALQTLFPGSVNSARDRFFLWSVWIQERKQVCQYYEELRGKPLSRSQKTSRHESQDAKEQVHCFCQRSYKLVRNVPMIQCGKCSKWLHGICAGVDPKAFRGKVPFECDICKGKLIVPPILQPTPTSSSTPSGGSRRSASRRVGGETPKRSASCDGRGRVRISGLFRAASRSGSHDKLQKLKHIQDAEKEEISNDDDDFQRKGGKSSTGRSSTAGKKTQSDVEDTEDSDADYDQKQRNLQSESSTEELKETKSYDKKRHNSDSSELDDFNFKLDDRFSSQTGGHRHSQTSRRDSLSRREDDVEEIDRINNRSTLEKLIEEEALRQHEAEAGVPLSRAFASKLMAHGLEDGDNDVEAEIKLPVSPEKKKKKSSSPVDESASKEDDDDASPVGNNDSSGSDNEADLIDTSKIPSSISEDIPYEKWRPFIRTVDDDKRDGIKTDRLGKKLKYYDGMRVDAEYTNVFSDIFDQYNEVCILRFYYKEIKPNAVRGNFFLAYANCKREPKDCPAKWSFAIAKRPHLDSNKSVKVDINLMTSVGPYHRKGYTDHRRCHGTKQDQMREEVKYKKAAAARNRREMGAPSGPLDAGKLSFVKPLSAWKQARYMAKKAEDLDKDVLMDVILTRNDQNENQFPDKSLPGYIQEISVFPLRIILFTKGQLQILHRVIKRFGPQTLQMDATGSLIRSCPAPYDDGQILIYTIIMRSPKKNESVLPIAEMYTTSHNTVSIAFFLKTVFECFRIRFNVKLPFYGIQRLEIDFAKANIAAAVATFCGTTTAEYLHELWNRMAGVSNDNREMFAIHICRFHVTRALQGHLAKGIGVNPDEDSKAVVEKWIHRLTHALDLWDFHRLVSDAAFLFGQAYLTRDLLRLIDRMDLPTPREGLTPWRNFTFSNSRRLDIPFYRRSPFGAFCEHIFDQMNGINNKIKDSGKNLPLNPLYDPEFLKVLKQSYFPYYPILSHSILEVLNVNSSTDTTNAIEQYHGLLKTNIYENEKNQRIGRFIRQQAQFVQGCINHQISALASLSQQKQKPTGSQAKIDAEDGNQDKNETISSQKGEASQFSNLKRPDEDNARNTPNKEGGEGSQEEEERPTTTSDGYSDIDSLSEDDDLIPKLPGQAPVDAGAAFTLDGDGKKASAVTPRVKKKKKKPHYPYDPERPRSPEAGKESWADKKKTRKKTQTLVDNFDVPLIPWGGKISMQGKTVSIKNSCSLDSSIQILLAMYRRHTDFKSFLDSTATVDPKSQQILQTILALQKRDWDTAKTIWMEKVLELELKQVLDKTFHSEDEYGWTGFKHWFPTKRNVTCSNVHCPGPDKSSWKREIETIYDLRPFSVDHFLLMVNRDISANMPCSSCEAQLRVTIDFEFDVPFLCYAINEDGQLKSLENFLRFTQTIKGVKYDVFAYTVLVSPNTSAAHFYVKFREQNKNIVYNGLLSKPFIEQTKSNEIVTSVWLRKSSSP